MSHRLRLIHLPHVHKIESLTLNISLIPHPNLPKLLLITTAADPSPDKSFVTSRPVGRLKTPTLTQKARASLAPRASKTPGNARYACMHMYTRSGRAGVKVHLSARSGSSNYIGGPHARRFLVSTKIPRRGQSRAPGHLHNPRLVSLFREPVSTAVRRRIAGKIDGDCARPRAVIYFTARGADDTPARIMAPNKLISLPGADGSDTARR